MRWVATGCRAKPVVRRGRRFESVRGRRALQMRPGTDRQTFARTIDVVLTEMAELVARFYGHVLKYTGNGLIAYFAPPTFNVKADAALDRAYLLETPIERA